MPVCRLAPTAPPPRRSSAHSLAGARTAPLDSRRFPLSHCRPLPKSSEIRWWSRAPRTRRQRETQRPTRLSLAAERRYELGWRSHRGCLPCCSDGRRAREVCRGCPWVQSAQPAPHRAGQTTQERPLLRKNGGGYVDEAGRSRFPLSAAGERDGKANTFVIARWSPPRSHMAGARTSAR